MKSKFLFFLVILCMPFLVHASMQEKGSFSKCVDGDTFKVNIHNEERTVRFLAIDTPETKHPKKKEEPFGKEASEFTCLKVQKAKKIVLEYDENSDKEDKYGRLLAWIWIDDQLLQKELVEKGYAKVAYLYGDYIYTDLLQDAEKKAKTANLGIWGDYKEEPVSYWLIIIGILLFLLFLCFNASYRKKVKRKVKKKVKKSFQKEWKKIIK